MEHNLDTLPPEQGGQLLRFLPPHNLCRVVLISSTMQTLASDPKLWSGMKVKKSKIHEEGLKKLFTIKRFSEVRKIDLSGMTFTAEKLLANTNAIAESSVEDLNLFGVHISQVPAQLLSQVVGQLHKIDLGATGLTTKQSTAVLEACASSPGLVEVSLAGIDLHEVPPQLLAKAVKHHHKMNLRATHLTSKQSTAVLEACASSPGLVDVSLAEIDLREVPPKLLAKGNAVKHFHKVDLSHTRLTTEQSTAVLEACVSSTELVDVSLSGINLSEVPPQLLAHAVKHLHKMDLRFTGLTTEQSTAVLEACVSSPGLVEVSLSCIDLREVPPQQLAQTIKHLHKMDIGRTRLTTEQSIAALEACASSPELVDVSLAGINLSEVPPQLLANSVKHLHKVDLRQTHLTTEQSTAVLEACASSPTLVNVSVAWIGLHEVPPRLLAHAVKHLHKVDLSHTRLTTEQFTAVLEACASSTGLVDVSLSGINLSEVPPQLLAKAAKHLQKVNLREARLTTEQTIAVLEACASSTELVEVSLPDDDLLDVPAELLARARDAGCLRIKVLYSSCVDWL